MLRSEEAYVQARGREATPRRWLPFCAAPASTALLAASTMSHSIFAYPNLRSTRAMSPRRGALATPASTSHMSCQYGSLSSTALATGLYGGATNDRCGRSRPMSQRTIPVEAQNMPANTTLIDTASTHGLPSTTAHRNSSQIRLSYLKET